MSTIGAKRAYRAMYCASWEKNPMLKDWIEAVPGKEGKAFCRVCQCFLYAHRYSVLKHTCTIKHQQNADKYRGRKTNVVNTASVSDEIQSEKSAENSDTIQQVDIINGHVVECKETPVDVANEHKEDSYEDVIEEEIVEVDFIEDVAEDIECEEYQFEEADEVSAPSSPLEPDQMTSHRALSISTHILDTSRGLAAGNVPVTIFKLESNVWKQLNQTVTNEDGRVATLLPSEDHTIGLYKLHFNTSEYFQKTTSKFLYPFVEIAFNCEDIGHYHIPLLLNPFGYSTYRGT